MPPQLSYLKMTFLYDWFKFSLAKSKYLICLFHYIGYAFYQICLFPCMPFSIYAFSHICLFPSLPGAGGGRVGSSVVGVARKSRRGFGPATWQQKSHLGLELQDKPKLRAYFWFQSSIRLLLIRRLDLVRLCPDRLKAIVY